MASSRIAKRRASAKADSSKHYQTRRAAVIKAAAGVFREKGFEGASLDEIGAAAGVDRASLYYYVGNKKELFDEVVLEALASNLKLAERIKAESGGAVDKLDRLIKAWMVSYGEFYPYFYIFLQESKFAASDKDEIDLLAMSREFDSAVIEIIQEGIEAGEIRDDIPPRVAAYAVMGMVNWTHRWFNPDGPIGAEEVGRAFAGVALAGLRTVS